MIKGEYIVKDDNGNVLLDKHNLITSQGEEYFLNRWIKQTNEVINSVGVSTGTNTPNKNDTGLNIVSENGEIVYPKFVSPSKRVDIKNKEIILEATFPSEIINNTTEIGVFASIGTPTYNKSTNNYDNAILISHDTYSKITAPAGIELTLNYHFSIDNSRSIKNWDKYYVTTDTSAIGTNVYYSNLNENVLGIIEDGFTSYTKSENLDTVIKEPASYIQINNILYIHCTDDKIPYEHDLSIEY